MFIFRNINVVGNWRVLNQIKLLVTLYFQSHLSLNNGLPASVPLGSFKASTKKIRSIKLRTTSMAFSLEL